MIAHLGTTVSLMILKGKTQTDIDLEQKIVNDKIALDEAQKEIDYELNLIIKTMAIEKYIEKQRIINADTRDTII